MASNRQAVLASGVFDVLHPGHVHYLSEARKLGDRLVVIVTSDGHAARSKRPPVHSAEERAELVGSLEVVDEAIVGADPYDLRAMLDRTQPDIIVLGYDQGFDEDALEAECVELGHAVKVHRVAPLPGAKLATRDII